MITITEALAELATIDKRLPKKVQALAPYVARIESMKDPLAKSGGSEAFLTAEKQSYGDLIKRKIALRRAIAKANAETELTIDGQTMSVADWLVWKREGYAQTMSLLNALKSGIAQARGHAQQHNVTLVRSDAEASENDIVVNLDEQALLREMDALEEAYGRLDGLLSLKNATTTIDI